MNQSKTYGLTKLIMIDEQIRTYTYELFALAFGAFERRYQVRVQDCHSNQRKQEHNKEVKHIAVHNLIHPMQRHRRRPVYREGCVGDGVRHSSDLILKEAWQVVNTGEQPHQHNMPSGMAHGTQTGGLIWLTH